ncbi:Luciferase-like monooxygenase [Aeromicrobium marinum DSM 15272]|uniref:Luciferase-like monooxygenase n=1 Tax=Aeromicrobium marinum DSM 15272 TaxID=585531 RepID=E2SAR9_9ACTN|nr:LLM class flavin-dependent oxidoreductase [Aeromicrobium marinum]EFQ83465.1 Luciferase-like monooxygenase [Aeromicrobium marinum DSM 15272]
MRVGVAIPQMAEGYGPGTTVAWARGIDAGPFSSVSAGERVTFTNPEMVATLAACAAVTENVRILSNVWVLPQHAMPMVAQQIGTLDQLANGRLDVAVGVGAREDDYRALGREFTRRHARLDANVAELRDLLAGRPPFEGADPVGPLPVQAGGPRILAGAMGPKAMRRAARWADGISGFDIAGDAQSIRRVNDLADRCWQEADREAPPVKISGSFVAIGIEDSAATLRSFAGRYLGFLGPELAGAFARTAGSSTPDALRTVLDGAKEAGCDEFILVPGTTDLRCLDAVAEVVAARG